jgi:O-antigen/teichoic acid export membrane protein
MILLNETATGLFVAPLTMVMIINPFLMGLTNVFLPASVSAFAAGQGREVQQSVQRFVLLLLPILFVFLIAVILIGPALLAVVYGGEYSSQGLTLFLLGVTVAVRALALPANIGLLVFERWRSVFLCSSAGLVVTIFVTLALVPTMLVTGAALAVLTGDITAASLRWIMYSSITRAWRA